MNCNRQSVLKLVSAQNYQFIMCVFADPGDAVLIRAVEPIEGEITMKENRIKCRKGMKELADNQISNGPSKLCQVKENVLAIKIL